MAGNHFHIMTSVLFNQISSQNFQIKHLHQVIEPVKEPRKLPYHIISQTSTYPPPLLIYLVLLLFTSPFVQPVIKSISQDPLLFTLPLQTFTAFVPNQVSLISNIPGHPSQSCLSIIQ